LKKQAQGEGERSKISEEGTIPVLMDGAREHSPDDFNKREDYQIPPLNEPLVALEEKRRFCRTKKRKRAITSAHN